MKSLIKFNSLIFIMLLSCVLLFVTEALQAQSTAAAYKVQVASHRNPSLANFAELSKIGEVRAENLSNGVTRIVLGYYATKAAADKVATKAKALGYADAFVRKHDGSNSAYNTASAASQKVVYRRKNPNAKINTSYIPMEKPKPAPTPQIVYTKPEPPPPAVVQPSVQTIYKKQEPAPQIVYTQPPVQVAVPTPAPVYVPAPQQQQVVQQQKTVVNTVVESACAVATPAALNEALGSNQTYMIDLGVYPDPNTVPSLGAANQLGIIYQKRMAEGGNTAYFGEYSSLAEAQGVLNVVRLQQGLSCAIIRKLDRISLEENATSEVTTKVSGVAPTMAIRSLKVTAAEAANATQMSNYYYPAPANKQATTTTTYTTTTLPATTTYTQQSGGTTTYTQGTSGQQGTTTYTQGATTYIPTTPATTTTTTYTQGQGATTYIPTTPATTTTTNTVTTGASTVSAFTTLRSYFPPASFTLLNIDAFDPMAASPNEANDKLRGNQIPPQLVPMVDNTPNRDPNLAFYALQQFAITTNYQGYIVRTGKGNYDSSNSIHMYVFDQSQNKFTQKYDLSSVSNTNGVYTKQQSWIVDLSSDGILDILSYKISESNQNQQFSKDKQLKAKVWVDNQFLDAQIVDENKLKQKLGLE